MFTLGIDYGTNSVRALIVRASDGKEYGTGVVDYPSGTQGVLLDPRDHNVARQSPADYLYGLQESVARALREAVTQPDFDVSKVAGIGVDSTGSSPLPVDAANQALGMLPQFENNPNAQCWLWKDHTSWREAARITELAAEHRPQYIAMVGSTYSSEWWWSKIWRCLTVAPDVFAAAHSWVELADWVPSVLAGVKTPSDIVRGVCAAGHKALYNTAWNGLPDKEFLAMLDPKIAELRDRLYDKAYDAATPAGALSAEWADKLGLPAGIPIAVGAFDVHYGAIGCGVEEGTLVKVIGTSTCDCAVVPVKTQPGDIPGICGIVEGSILPGFFGVEAGQSAVGDIFKWWVEGVCGGSGALHGELTAEAEQLKPGQSGLLALDWNNGNRTILVDQRLSGLILGQTLYTTRSEIYRALVEATAFGARAIIERIREYGVAVDRVVCTGGIAEKNPMLMQIYADVTGCTMLVAGSSQTCALGGAIAASVLAGAHPDFETAQSAMTALRDERYTPIAANQAVYNDLYTLYRDLHDSFGGLNKQADLSGLMKSLIDIKYAANS
ncbi:ribulokinase [Rhizobium sp. Leaf384]|uniref:ribulokinase n=1 Tax=unclassified Rhizobium TaxID=2613769 RepID=UPI000712909A|nr:MULTISPECIES: ribulokinase [unclassified Rhizobium]KQS77075.1 ribulokinase [Rhizobium sp. Leaf384]KQS78346.1 ribulokinase [Rhizobium sp. Leaf383]